MKPILGTRSLRVLANTLAITLALAASGPAPAAGWFRPPEQSLPAICIQSALAAYPGKIERIHVNTATTGAASGSKARIYIEQPDGREWIVFCNMKSGAIEKAILVDDL